MDSEDEDVPQMLENSSSHKNTTHKGKCNELSYGRTIIRCIALGGYGSIVHEVKPNGLLTCGS